MTLRRLLLLTIISLALLSCKGSSSDETNISNRLVVMVSEDTPGSFEINGETYGYQYELFSSYASSLGLELEYLDAGDLTAQKRAELIENGVDIITSKFGESELELHGVESSEVYTTGYVVVTRSDIARDIRRSGISDVAEMMQGRKVLLSSEFKKTQNYDLLLDELSMSTIYLSSRNGFYLMESLYDGSYDFLICENSEAQLGCALVGNVEQIYSFKERVAIVAEVTSNREDVIDGFYSWLSNFRNGKEYAMLNYMYFERGIVSQFMPAKSGGNRISDYDEMIREISEREGLDWRFVSAIAYNESRFMPHVKSHRGAEGLMQIMPVVARAFNVDQADVAKPENNILLGVRLLNKISSSLKFPKGTPEEDKMRIILACYNAGIGHVIDARNLAKKYGCNPDSWAEMSHFLNNKSQYADDDVVKCGRFRGTETMAFVEDVVSKYNSYCAVVAR